MTRDKSTFSSVTSMRRALAIAAGSLVLVLVVLFHRSLAAGQVLHNNDAPLGALLAYIDATLGFLTGAWHDLNWLGTPEASALPNLTYSVMLLLKPVLFSKFMLPLSLLFLGLSAWLLFRSLGFEPWVCLLGGMAVMLNSDPFSYGAWGLTYLPLSMGCTFLALAALASQGRGQRLLRLALAGFATGMAVMEGYDTGAILSLFVAAFTVFLAFQEPGSAGLRIGRGVVRVAVVALCAGWLALQALSTLIGTQVQGVVGMDQTPEARQRRWSEATQWSLPKAEALRVVVAGLYGYRLDTGDGGNYWGGVGRDPAWDAYLDAPSPDRAQAPGNRLLRHSGAGFYGGVFVVFIALWAVAQSWRTSGGPFDRIEQRHIRFWSVVAVVSLLLSFGRHAPLYQFFYALPYFSTIRNPIKFLHPFNLAVVILFAYGLQGLWRSRLAGPAPGPRSLRDQWKNWWRTAASFDRNCLIGALLLLGLALVAWLIYGGSRPAFVQRLALIGFPDEAFATSLFRFSVKEVGWSVLFLTLSLVWFGLVSSGWMRGPRSRWAVLAGGLILVLDLGRANLPWIVYYDYLERYASNPVVEVLRDKPFNHRVAGELIPRSQSYLVNKQGGYFAALYGELWLQQLFPFNRIQTLDVVQAPRPHEMDLRYLQALTPSSPADLSRAARLWQLTNTRFLLGMAEYAEGLNQQIDPQLRRFRVHSLFDVVPKPGVTQLSGTADLTAVTTTNGPFAIMEFTGALPRANLYSQWLVETNDSAALATLASPSFDPEKQVLLANEEPVPAAGSAGPAGSVEIEHYDPKTVKLRARATQDCILLLNDRHHPDWQVTVDDQPKPLLRCNYIMRGVRLPPGDHVVQFRFEAPKGPLVASLTGLGAALLGCVALCFWPRRPPSASGSAGAPPPSGRSSRVPS